jgi:hypothetical protein
MLLPASTGFGEATLETDRFGAVVPTTVVTVAVLLEELGSAAEELTDAVSEITVPFAVPAFTFTTSVKVPAVEPSILELLQTTLPVPPTPGPIQLQPAGDAMETNVVFAGTGATSVALSAALGPLLVTTCVYVILPPAATGFGDPVLVTLMSALETTLATSVALSFARFTSPPPLTSAVFVTVDGAVCATLALSVIEG